MPLELDLSETPGNVHENIQRIAKKSRKVKLFCYLRAHKNTMNDHKRHSRRGRNKRETPRVCQAANYA